MTTPTTLVDIATLPPIIRGDTKDILLTLYKNLLQIKQEVNATALSQAVALDLETAINGKKLISMPNRLQTTADAISASFEQLNASNNKEKIAFAASQLPTFNGLTEKITTLQDTKANLLSRYAALTAEQLSAIRVWLLDLNDQKLSLEAVLENIKLSHGKVENFAKEVEMYIKNYQDIQSNLDTLYRHLYIQVPDRSRIPVPYQETPTIHPT